MYTLGAGRIFIKRIIIVCLLNLLARKASWGAFVYRNGLNYRNGLLYMALSACNAFYMHRMAYRFHREKKIRVACILGRSGTLPY